MCRALACALLDAGAFVGFGSGLPRLLVPRALPALAAAVPCPPLTPLVAGSGGLLPSWARTASDGAFRLLKDDKVVMDRTRDRIRIKPASGLSVAVTGGPWRCRARWFASGVRGVQRQWLEGGGFRFTFSRPVPRIFCPRNGKGCSDPRFVPWLVATLEELVCLGVLEESRECPHVVLPIDVVVKSGYDEVSAPWRLRLIWNGVELNRFVEIPRFRMETLEEFRSLLEPDDVIMTFDIAGAFWHILTHPDHRRFQAFRFGGRYWCWRGAPMGARSTPFVWQSLMWTVTRVLRERYGYRLINFCDDFAVALKRWQVPEVERVVMGIFRDHGLLPCPSKCPPLLKARRVAEVLGVGVDMDRFVFFVPAKKRTKIVAGIDELLAESAAGRPVRLRLFAKTCGRINALAVVFGLAVRRLLRECWSFIKASLGLPESATPRDIRVAWNVSSCLTPLVLERLRFWRSHIQACGQRGSPIRPPLISPRVVFGSDTGESAWAGFVDFGDGYRLVARDVLLAAERGTSSTLREAIGSARSMLALLPEVVSVLRRRGWPSSLLIITDSQVLAGSLEAGAKSPGIQVMVARIFMLLLRKGVQFVSRWAPRSSAPMVFADDGSKLESLRDTCDFKLLPEVFELAQRVFGVRHNWDRFASSVNRQGGSGVRFSSLHFCPGASAPDAFAVGWGGVDVDNWLFPPFVLVGRALRHLFECRGRGTIVVPWVSRAPWWPFVRRRAPGVVSAPSGERRIELPRRNGLLLRAGSIPLSAKEQRFPLLIVRLDFSSFPRGAPCPS
jgi:hypothetical protein